MLFKMIRLISSSFLLGSILLGQQQRSPAFGNDRLPTISEQLRQHNIALTHPALLEALSNESSEVRWLAAQELANEAVRDAVPAIDTALSRESVPIAKVNIADALARLGGAHGSSVLKQICGSPDFNSGLRTLAITYLLNLHDDGCLTAVMELMETQDDQAKIDALGVLPRFQHLSKEEFEKLGQLTQSSLTAQTPALRIAAAHALSNMKDIAAIPALENAIANEQDGAVRSAMQSDLKTLQRENKQ